MKFAKCTYKIAGGSKPLFEDEILIPMTPLMAKLCQAVFEERALSAKTFAEQGTERDMAEYFGMAVAGYHETRNAYEASRKKSDG